MELWREIRQGALPDTTAGIWVEEKVAQMPLPKAFDGFVEKSKRVSPTLTAMWILLIWSAIVGAWIKLTYFKE